MTDQERIEYEQAVSQLRLTYVDTEFSATWAEGRAMPMEQAIQLALS
jgi:hypothetical protein